MLNPELTHAADCDLKVMHKSVSRHHADVSVSVEDGKQKLMVTDLSKVRFIPLTNLSSLSALCSLVWHLLERCEAQERHRGGGCVWD